MSRRVWLDDIRKPPRGFVEWVKTADEAIAALTAGDVELISLDHDLASEHYADAVHGYGESALDRSRFRDKTGYDVVLWMIEHNVWPATIYVHTLNPVGRLDMVRALRKHAPPGTVIDIRPALI